MKQLLIICALLTITPAGIYAEEKESAERPVPAWLQEPEQTERSAHGLSLLTVMQGLGLTLGVFFVGLALYQRKRGVHLESSDRRLVLRERLALTQKTSLLLVEVDGKSYLCSVGAETVSLTPHHSFTAALHSVEDDTQYREEVCTETLQRLSA